MSSLSLDSTKEQSHHPIHLVVETPKAVLVEEELRLLEKAIAHDPANRMFRRKQANCLHNLSRFDEAIAVLEGLLAEQVEFPLLLRLALIKLAVETPAAYSQAKSLSQHACEIAANDTERAIALATRGKAEKNLGESQAAEKTVLEALNYDPQNRDAFKRLAALKSSKQENRELLKIIDQLQHKGVNHSRLLSALALARLNTGAIEEARQVFGLDEFLHKTTMSPPPGWQTIEDFNADLVEEMSNHPSIRYDRPGAASQRTWRVDNPATRRSKVVPLLQAMILEEVKRYAKSISGSTHPWVNSTPDKGQLHNWCVMTDGDGYEEWHVHEHGWLSGVYYAGVPENIAKGTGSGGCIAFGIPADLAGEVAQSKYGMELIRPSNGLLMLFPSHCYHRTFPHFEGGRRTCLAFDIQPL